MGYSAFIIAKGEKLQKKMYSFLDQHMIGYNKHFHNSDDCYFGLRIGAKGSQSLSYKGGKINPLMIGFDFGSSGGGEGQHMYKLLEWMSKKIGTKPGHYYYDGEPSKFSTEESFNQEAEQLFKAKDPGNKITIEDIKRSILSFTLVIHPIKYKNIGTEEAPKWEQDGGKTNEEIDKEIKDINDFIDGDIKRLDELWTKQMKDESVSI